VAGTPLQNIIATRVFIGTNEVVSYGTNWFSSGLDQAGADGNPGTVNGQYGWNVRIVYQTNSWAEIVIWNSHYDYLDDDGDGVPNWQEAVAGTDPKDAKSFLRFTSASLSPVDGRLLLEWTSATNRTYTVLRASSLRTEFQSIATNLPASPPLNSFLVPDSGPSSAAFYRLQVE
jgi:hypothetical protein